MGKTLRNIFLNNKLILFVILLNTIIIFLEESNSSCGWLDFADFACTIFFLVEMVVKMKEYGFTEYWKRGWNKMDGCLVILSLPSIIQYIFSIEMLDLSFLLALRMLRLLRLFKTLHFFPDIIKVVTGFKLALKQSYAVLMSFFIIIVVFGLINKNLFADIAPEYFGTPFRSIYSVFRMFTIEGWYEIPDAIANATSPLIGKLSVIYLCGLLITCGIIGMSFINSIFVDAMVSDNNDDMKAQLDKMEKQLDELKKLMEENKREK